MREPTRADDLAVLRILDLREREGMTATEIASALGKTKGQISGLLHRIKRDEQPGAEHLDGTMPERWWQ